MRDAPGWSADQQTYSRHPAVAGSIVSGIAAYLSVRFLMKYFQTRTLTPFAIYCFVFGLASFAYLTLK